VMRWLALRNGIVDLPDAARKNHIEPIAYLGGVALFFYAEEVWQLLRGMVP